MGFGLGNTDAVDHWRNGEGYDKRSRRIMLNTDGVDLRIYDNIIARRTPTHVSPHAFVWTMCGYETQTTTAALGAIGVQIGSGRYASNSYKYRGFRLTYDDVRISMSQPVNSHLVYRSGRPVLASNAPLQKFHNARRLSGPVAGVGVYCRYKGADILRQPLRLTDDVPEVFVPRPEDMTFDYKAALASIRVRHRRVLLQYDGLTRTPDTDGVYAHVQLRVAVRRSGVVRAVVEGHDLSSGLKGTYPLLTFDLPPGRWTRLDLDLDNPRLRDKAAQAGEDILVDRLMRTAAE